MNVTGLWSDNFCRFASSSHWSLCDLTVFHSSTYFQHHFVRASDLLLWFLRFRKPGRVSKHICHNTWCAKEWRSLWNEIALHSCQAGKHATLARSLPNSPFVMIALVADGTLNCERNTKQRKMITFGSPLEELKTEASVWHFIYFHITKIFWLSNQGPNSTWPEDTVWINHQERKLHPPSQRKETHYVGWQLQK